jgi:hypothetical protein
VKDITGHRFGSVVALSPRGRKWSRIQWLCRCDCGTENISDGAAIRRGAVRSCGCRTYEARRPRKSKALSFEERQNMKISERQKQKVRLRDGRCPVHGLPMPQIGRWHYPRKDKAFTIVGCPRRDCSVIAKAREPFQNYELFRRGEYRGETLSSLRPFASPKAKNPRVRP